MTPQATLWTLTTLGSLVFFLLGWVWRGLGKSSSTQAPLAVTLPQPDLADDPRLEPLQAELRLARKALEQFESRTTRTQGQIAALTATAQQLGEERERLVKECDGLQANLRASFARSSELDLELAASRDEMAQLTARLQTAQSHALRSQKQAEQANRQAASAPRTQPPEDLAAAQQTSQSLEASVGELQARLDKMTKRAADAQRLRERVRLLEARLFAVEGALPLDPISEPPPSMSAVAVNSAPAALMQSPGMRTVVLADGSGLLVSGEGDGVLHDGLSALCGLVMEFVDRIAILVPLSRVSSVRVVDDKDMAVFCGLLSRAGDPYALAAIGPVTLPSDAWTRAMELASFSIERRMRSS